MEVEKAKWYLSDFGNTIMSSDMRESVRTVLEYIKELEEKVIELEKTKEK